MKKFNNEIVLYVPAYNCAKQMEHVLNEIPVEVFAKISLLIVDNCSLDGTANKAIGWAKGNSNKCDVTIIRPVSNLGYSGSQKLAYSILINPEIAGNVRKVIMLHGDGQYPPLFLSRFAEFFESDKAIVYGYRSKSAYGEKEETPWHTYILIKLLSALESLITGISRKEWHSGFAMYDISFLKRVRLAALTDSPHIDGHLQFAAGQLGLPVETIPIYKRYKDFEAFGGTARIYYVLRVLYLIAGFRFSKNEILGSLGEPPKVFAEYEVIFQS